MGSGASANISSYKINADVCFKSGDYYEAVVWYSRAIDEITINQADLTALSHHKDLAVLFSNRSAAFYMSRQFERSIEDALRVVDTQPLWAKGYYRVGLACHRSGRREEGWEYLCRAKALAPDDASIEEAIASLAFAAPSTSGLVSRLHRSQGCLFTWGLSDSQALGHEDSKDKHSPCMVEKLRGMHIVDVACGAMHTVAVSSVGETYAWGDNKYGQVGISEASSRTLYLLPALVTSLLGVHIDAVSCGSGHTVVMAITGSVFSWGLGAHGQLGHGLAEHSSEPRQIETLRGQHVTAVACGIAHTVFLLADGVVMGCGMNSYGALGMDTHGESVLSPVDIPLPGHPGGAHSAVVHMACGGAHTVVVNAEGYMYGCGSNSCGQLGVGPPTEGAEYFTLTPVDVFVDGESHAERGRVRCTFVACGEEFTVLISSTRQVYTTGLGIAGQMGHGSTGDLHRFTCVSALNGKGVEEVACAQGAVFALSENGHVYTWGLPGHRHRDALNASSDCLAPSLAGSFSKRKRARQISCGRKHYALLTIAPFGGTSYIVGEDGPRQSLMGSNSCNVIAGKKKLKFTIQTCDAKGDIIDYGGYVFAAVWSRQTQIEDSDADDWWCEGEGSSVSFNFDDNFDGTYSVETAERLHCAGHFRLDLSLDGVALLHSPFSVEVQHGEVCPAHCQVRVAGSDTKDGAGVGRTDPITALSAQCNERLHLEVMCVDDFGNRITSPSIDMETIHAELRQLLPDERSSEVYSTTLTFANSCAVFELRSPAVSGTYELKLSFGNHVCGDLIGGSALSLHCLGSPFDPQHCDILVPTVVSVDQSPLLVQVKMMDTMGHPVEVDMLGGGPLVTSIVTPLTSGGLSARALMRLNSWQHNPYGPVKGTISWKSCSCQEDGSVALLSHQVRVSGEAHVEVTIGHNNRVFTSSVEITPGAPSPDFTELLNPREALREWGEEEKCRFLKFQSRDQFGNKCQVCGDLLAEINVEGSDVKVQLEVERNEGTGIVVIKAVMLTDHVAPHVLCVNIVSGSYWQELQYSPFTIGGANDVEFEGAESGPAPPQASVPKRAPLKMSAQEKTNRRAFAALRQKRRDLVRDKQERIRNRAARRTGGGFVIQYSKDI